MKEKKKEDLAPGGQAVMEGVMMRSHNKLAIAVRKEDGNIVIKKETLKKPKYKFMTWPFIRGIVNLIHMMVVGIKALTWSSNQLMEEEEELTTKEIVWLIIISFGFAMLLFVALPYFLTGFSGVEETVNPIIFNLIDGVIKIALFIGYIVVISFMKDIKRLFMYHGAEHKAVYCYEKDKELTVKNCQKMSRLHPRCGTSFIVIVLIISIFVFSVLPIIAKVTLIGFELLNPWIQKAILFPVRILFIPLIAAIAYEILKLSGKYADNWLVKLLILPGLGVQLLTTKEPDDDQLEVAIKSLKEVI